MKNLLKNEKAVKSIGIAVTLVGFGITLIQKQLEDKKLEDLVAKKVEEEINKYEVIEE